MQPSTSPSRESSALLSGFTVPRRFDALAVDAFGSGNAHGRLARAGAPAAEALRCAGRGADQRNLGEYLPVARPDDSGFFGEVKTKQQRGELGFQTCWYRQRNILRKGNSIVLSDA